MQTTPVPSHRSMNAGVGAWRLIDCITAIPAGAAARRRPSITKVDHAKNTPPFSPQPIAAARVRTSRPPDIAASSAEQPEADGGGRREAGAGVAGGQGEGREGQPPPPRAPET